MALNKVAFAESTESYGSPRLCKELREKGKRCGKNRVPRLMRANGIRAKRRYGKPRWRYTKPALLTPNTLNREFSVAAPDLIWVTDITYIATSEGWLYLAVVKDLFSRRLVGWATGSMITTELVLTALLAAIWRGTPKGKAIVHSDQGSQFNSDELVRFCRDHNVERSMSRRGNCHDNAVAESFFSSLKKERIRGRTYFTRDEARAYIFDYREVFYNRRRRHSTLGMMGPAEFEQSSAEV